MAVEVVAVFYWNREAQPPHAEGYRLAESGYYWRTETREPSGPFPTERSAHADAADCERP